jgi:4-amino-4-deoxy-L-arabinose transferase-like glycosyltransferase
VEVPVPSVRRRLAVILLLALLLRVGIAVAVRGLQPQGDECAFLHAARSVLAGEGFRYGTLHWDDGHTPPLYVLFLAGSLFVTGGSLTGVRILQAIVATGTAALVFPVARRWLGDRGALIAAGVAAFLPEHLTYFQYLFGETLF